MLVISVRIDGCADNMNKKPDLIIIIQKGSWKSKAQEKARQNVGTKEQI